PGPARRRPGRSISGLNFSPDGRLLAGQSFGAGWLWDLSADPPAVVPLGPAGPAASARWSSLPLLTPDGTGVLAATGPRELTLFDTATRERRQSYRLWHEQISFGQSVSFSPDGRRLLVNYSTESWLNRLLVRVQYWLRRAVI